MSPSVTVEIENVTTPATFKHLPDALAALWEDLRALPLGWTQAEHLHYTLGDTERVRGILDRNGELTLRLRLGGDSHAITIRPSTQTTAKASR